MPSHGEAWCIPAFDAMGFGKTPICTNIGGMKDFIGKGGFLIEGNMEPVFGMTRTFKRLFTCNEDWCSVSVRGLMEAMRHVYENQEKLKNIMRNYFRCLLSSFTGTGSLTGSSIFAERSIARHSIRFS